MRKKGIEKGVQGFAATHAGVMILLLIVALFIYSMHIPERWCPHTFDLWVSELTLLSHLFYGRLTVVFCGLLWSSGSKPPDLPYSHRCRSGCVFAGIAEGDARALFASRRADSFALTKRNQSFVVSALTREDPPQSTPHFSYASQAMSQKQYVRHYAQDSFSLQALGFEKPVLIPKPAGGTHRTLYCGAG